MVLCGWRISRLKEGYVNDYVVPLSRNVGFIRHKLSLWHRIFSLCKRSVLFNPATDWHQLNNCCRLTFQLKIISAGAISTE
jgi:hypothetical protein